MKKIRYRICILLIATMITGCKSNEDVITKEDDTIILTVLAGQSTSDAGVEDMIDESIKKKFPNVKLEWECVGWGGNFDASMRAKFSAGDVPDIMIGKAQDVKAYVKTGNLAPIHPLAIEKIKEEALEAVMIDGVPYGLPYNAWYQGVLYNREIFEAYSLKTPTTEEELDQVIEILKEHDVVPFASHYQESWSVGNTTMQFLMNEIFDDDNNWGDEFRSGKNNFSGSPKIIKSFENNKKILENSWKDVEQIDNFESDNRFAKGQAAMYVTGSWSLQAVNQYEDLSQPYGIFPFPNEEGNSKLLRETNMTFMKSAKSEHSELIDAIFSEILMDEKLTQEILDFTQTSSVMKNVESEFESCIAEDIKSYEANKNVLDVTRGNIQLVWPFQNDVASQQIDWLLGKQSLEEVLIYADNHRSESKNE